MGFNIGQEELDLLFGEKYDLFSNQAKLNKNVGLPIHMLSGLLNFLNGKFTKILKDDKGDVYLEFYLPFEHMKTNQFGTIYSPKLKMSSKRTIEKGNIIMKSPISGFRNFKPYSLDKAKDKSSRISSIRETLRHVDSLAQDELSSIMRT